MKFLVKLHDDRRQTRNSGVVSAGTHQGIEDDYYGNLEEVIELLCIKDYRVVLFKCKWFDIDRRRKHVTYKPHCISADTSREEYKEDPFVFATQVRQIFYIDDQSKSNPELENHTKFSHTILANNNTLFMHYISFYIYIHF